MDKIIEKLEAIATNFITDLETKPVKTIVKTVVIIWLIQKAVKFLKTI